MAHGSCARMCAGRLSVVSSLAGAIPARVVDAAPHGLVTECALYIFCLVLARARTSVACPGVDHTPGIRMPCYRGGDRVTPASARSGAYDCGLVSQPSCPFQASGILWAAETANHRDFLAGGRYVPETGCSLAITTVVQELLTLGKSRFAAKRTRRVGRSPRTIGQYWSGWDSAP